MTKPYYHTQLGELYLGDCIDILANMPDKSVDLIVTSPPYNIGMVYDEYKDDDDSDTDDDDGGSETGSKSDDDDQDPDDEEDSEDDEEEEKDGDK
jgi:DNA modification methylase